MDTKNLNNTQYFHHRLSRLSEVTEDASLTLTFLIFTSNIIHCILFFLNLILGFLMLLPLLRRSQLQYVFKILPIAISCILLRKYLFLFPSATVLQHFFPSSKNC